MGDENVVGLVSLKGQPVALVGLDHQAIGPGKVLGINEASSRVKVDILAWIYGQPRAWASHDDSLLVATVRGLYRISPPRYEQMTVLHLDGLGPTSVVALESSEIFIGMSLFVLRLIPEGEHYREQWLMPTDCRRYEVTDSDCLCLGKADKAVK